MTVTADILRRLGRLRLEPEAFEEVLTIIADVQAMEEARRLQQRERVARHRAMKRNGDVPVTLPANYSNGHSTETPAGTVETVFSKSESYPPSPPKGGSVPPKKSKVRKPEKPQATLCPENLQPNESHYLKCEQRGVPRSVADRSAEIIINWSHSHADRDIAWKTDWPRALHRILDGEIEKAQRAAGSGITPRGRHPPTRTPDFWAGDSLDADRELKGGRYDERPFDTDARPWDRSRDAGGSRHDEPSPQQAGTDTGRFPPMRLVGGGRA